MFVIFFLLILGQLCQNLQHYYSQMGKWGMFVARTGPDWTAWLGPRGMGHLPKATYILAVYRVTRITLSKLADTTFSPPKVVYYYTVGCE
jgi:hypothetical protein